MTIITVAEALQHARASATTPEQTAEIQAFIDAAAAVIEKATGFVFTRGDRLFTLPTFTSRLALPRRPVVSVVSIEYIDASDAMVPLLSSAWRLTTVGDEACILSALGTIWPTGREVTVTATVGFASSTDIPGPLKAAAKMLVAHWYVNREIALVGQTAAPLPYMVDELLAPYRPAGLA